MHAFIKSILVTQLSVMAIPASSSESILWVDVNYFASERRLLGIQKARRDISEGKLRLYMQPIFGPFSNYSKREEKRLIRLQAFVDQVMREKGIEPVHAYPSECTGNAGEFAYVEAYNRTIYARMEELWGSGYWQRIENEADRRAHKQGNLVRSN
jgi:hypothetical protein